MKSCPSCNRTYADDTFTFCLNDGALLSAPYEPPRGFASQRPEPPPTEVMPHHLSPAATDLPPTMPALLPTARTPPRSPAKETSGPEASEGLSGAMIATITILILISLVLAVSLSRC